LAPEVNWRLDILPDPQRRLWEAKIRRGFPGWVLYGGTALALRLGHRESVDFDFFSAQPLQPMAFREQHRLWGDILQAEPNTLTVVHEGVKLSFFGGLSLRVAAAADRLGGCWVAAGPDLAATKLAALVNRVAAKDYRDVACLLSAHLSLEEMLGYARAVYGDDFPVAPVLKSLVYFDPPELAGLTKADRERIERAVAGLRKIPEYHPVAERIGGGG